MRGGGVKRAYVGSCSSAHAAAYIYLLEGMRSRLRRTAWRKSRKCGVACYVIGGKLELAPDGDVTDSISMRMERDRRMSLGF